MSDPNITNISTNQLYEIILAIGGLGTAAYGLVDATKSFGEYGPSQVGFSDIRKVVSRLLRESKSTPAESNANADAIKDLLETLQPNWINGMAMTDQKAIAKALIKLRLTPDTANSMAKATGTDPTILGSIATKLRPSATPSSGNTAQPGSESVAPSLNPSESDELGRFDLALSALLDRGYQRGDQRYRNCAKLLAVVFSVLIAVVTTWLTTQGQADHYMGLAIVAGLLATPLAPVAKDLASTIQAGAKVAQFWKK
jgi:hypothetical protein